MTRMMPLLRPDWKWPSHPLYLLIGYLLLPGQMTFATYQDEKCYCVSEEDATIREAIAAFTDTPPVSQYEYIGAMYNIYNITAQDFQPCVCNDVLDVVCELAVSEQYAVELAEVNVTDLNNNITKALDATTRVAFETYNELQHFYHSSFATYKETNDSNVIFTVNFIVKSTDTDIKEKVAIAMLEAVSEGMLEGVGSVNFTKEFTLSVCPEDPNPGTGTQTSTTNNVAGTSVSITCKDGFRSTTDEVTTAESRCVHNNLTWSAPFPPITCVEDKRCHRRPPNPINTRRVWDGQIEEGTQITYNCRILYKILTKETSTYMCMDKSWKLTSSEIKCDPPSCGDPPQVPDHGVLTYKAWDEIKYQCDTYAIRSGKNHEETIQCKNFTWEELPESFKCVGSDTYDGHQELENFLNITLPVSAVLVFVVILCLLGSRSDSPICKICKGTTKSID